jgi:hypothetical protein
MAELLLNEFVWIGGVQPVAEDRLDVFRLAAWFSSPDRVPTGMDLEIVEPPVASVQPSPMKRTLVYPVEISVSSVGQHLAAGPSSSNAGDGGW